MSLKSSYNKIAPHYTQTRKKHPWPSYFEFAKYLEPGQSLLDIGCGGGRTMDFLNMQNLQVDYTGIDFSEGMIDECKKQFSDKKFFVGDMTDLKLEENTHDVIWAFASFHHLDSPELRIQTLNEFKRVLKPGGYLCMTNWNFFSKRFLWDFGIQLNRLTDSINIPWKDKEGNLQADRYYHGFTKSELHKLFKNSGFEIIEEFYENTRGKTGWYSGMNICHVVKPSA